MLSIKSMFCGKGHVDVKAMQKAAALGQMELCQFEFYPMSKMVEPKYETVNITHLSVDEDGVYAKFKSDICHGEYGTYVGHFDGRGHSGWTGIFNTREEAEKCFKDTMAAWKANIP